MTRDQLAAWTASGESETLEFKKSTAERDRACRTLCAFANGQGGRLLFGVTPSGKAVGQTVADHTLEELAQEFQGFEPPLFPLVERVGIGAGREALANAFVHRDYAIGGGSVAVGLYDDRLEIISIGDLHFGLTPDALFREHESKPWNPMIARAFYRRGIIETWGRGTLKIARLMREAGLDPPTVCSREGAVIVTFGLPGKTTGKTTGKTAEAVLRLLVEGPDLSVPQLAARLEKSELTIHRAIRKLRESGRLLRIGPDKGGWWKVLE
jgi:ATP-dependent DNA helicase RecG